MTPQSAQLPELFSSSEGICLQKLLAPKLALTLTGHDTSQETHKPRTWGLSAPATPGAPLPQAVFSPGPPRPGPAHRPPPAPRQLGPQAHRGPRSPSTHPPTLTPSLPPRRGPLVGTEPHPGVDVSQELLPRDRRHPRHRHHRLLPPLHGRFRVGDTPHSPAPRPRPAASPRKAELAQKRSPPPPARRGPRRRRVPPFSGRRLARRLRPPLEPAPSEPPVSRTSTASGGGLRRRAAPFPAERAPRAGRGGGVAAIMALRAAPGRGRWLARALAVPAAARVLPPPFPASASVPPLTGLRALRPAVRFVSSAGQGPEAEGPQRRVVVVRITSPFAWLRTRFYYLLIRLYFDQEFSVEEFTRGAKQVGGGAGWGSPGTVWCRGSGRGAGKGLPAWGEKVPEAAPQGGPAEPPPGVGGGAAGARVWSHMRTS